MHLISLVVKMLYFPIWSTKGFGVKADIHIDSCKCVLLCAIDRRLKHSGIFIYAHPCVCVCVCVWECKCVFPCGWLLKSAYTVSQSWQNNCHTSSHRWAARHRHTHTHTHTHTTHGHDSSSLAGVSSLQSPLSDHITCIFPACNCPWASWCPILPTLRPTQWEWITANWTQWVWEVQDKRKRGGRVYFFLS